MLSVVSTRSEKVVAPVRACAAATGAVGGTYAKLKEVKAPARVSRAAGYSVPSIVMVDAMAPVEAEGASAGSAMIVDSWILPMTPVISGEMEDARRALRVSEDGRVTVGAKLLPSVMVMV